MNTILHGIQAGSLDTIAGNGKPGYTGDGEQARSARLNEPKNIAFDREGNLYIADSENHVIRKVDMQTGVIKTVAGHLDGESEKFSEPPSSSTELANEREEEDPLADTEHSLIGSYTQTPDLSGTIRYVVGQGSGSSKFGGDGGNAIQAKLNFPSSIAVDQHGVLYIADTWNHRIRQVNPITGIITTIAGTGQAKWTGDGGPAIEAALNEPVALILNENGLLYVADQSNNRVRMIDTNTGMITTVAGNGDTGYTGDGMPAIETSVAGPSGLALDSHGNLYIADTFNSRIRKLDIQTGYITTVVGDGENFKFQPGVNEESLSLARPYGITCDHKDCLLMTDSDNHLIRKWDPDNQSLTVIVGNGIAGFGGDESPARNGTINYPFGIAVDPWGNIAIADTFNHRIRVIVA